MRGGGPLAAGGKSEPQARRVACPRGRPATASLPLRLRPSPSRRGECSVCCRSRANGGDVSASASASSSSASSSSVAGGPQQKTLRVSFQGVHGAYSEQAAKKCFPQGTLVPCADFETTHKSVADMSVDRAVIPVENSLGGSIHVNYDLLMKHRLHVIGEVYHKVRHCLLANPGVPVEDIKRVQSHPQAISQCEGYLARLNGVGVIKEAVDDTAGAAQHIAAIQSKDTAALASSLAGELYGLNILDEDCQDNEENLTRFIVLSRDPEPLREDVDYKTSIVFAAGDKPGDLFKALSVFALREIDLTKIENRPIPQSFAEQAKGGGDGADSIFENLFYVDFNGSPREEACRNALKHLSEVSPFMRILGSYPTDLIKG